jgi:hypothetical protein
MNLRPGHHQYHLVKSQIVVKPSLPWELPWLNRPMVESTSKQSPNDNTDMFVFYLFTSQTP